MFLIWMVKVGFSVVAEGTALQAVRKCPHCCLASISLDVVFNLFKFFDVLQMTNITDNFKNGNLHLLKKQVPLLKVSHNI